MPLEVCPVPVGGRKLYGVLEGPEGPAQGAVVLVHGWGGCRVGPHRILVETARELVRRGFAVLRFDLSGRGESEGEPLQADLDGMIADTAAAIGALKDRMSPRTPLALLGMCSGGNVALAVAALREDVGAVVAWSTYPFQEQRSGSQDVRRTGHFLKVYLAKAIRPSTWKKLLRGGVHFGGVRAALFGHYARGDGLPRDLQRSRQDLLSALARYGGNALFVYGGGDPEASGAEKTFRAFCDEHGIRARFHTVAGANHNFYSLAWKREAIEVSCGWLDEATGEAHSGGVGSGPC